MPDVATLNKEWDRVRAAFGTSIMVDTPLASLAQNLDGPEWPVKGADETPGTYIDLNYEEVVERLALKGQPAERADQLIVILRDTLAFDAPFGEMVAQSEATATKDNPLLRNLAKLEISPDHPVDVTALSGETLEFCRLEKLTTLGEFAVFAQGMAQTIIVGGDFKELLNALSHIDERTLARMLPYRPGTKGLHLAEALAQLVRSLAPAQRTALLNRTEPVPTTIANRVKRILQVFSAQADQFRSEVKRGADLARFVTVLNDPETERVVIAMLHPVLAPSSAPIATVKSKPRSWIARLFSR